MTKRELVQKGKFLEGRHIGTKKPKKPIKKLRIRQTPFKNVETCIIRNIQDFYRQKNKKILL